MGSPAAVLQKLVGDVFGELAGVGIDLVDVDVMRDLVAEGGSAFIDAYWTAAEQSDAGGDPERLAGRWAAKEAVMKCLGVGVGTVDPIDVEILTLPSGAPRVRLRGRAAEAADELNLVACRVSMTHDGGWAAAIAVGQRRTDLLQPTPSPGGPTNSRGLDG